MLLRTLLSVAALGLATAAASAATVEITRLGTGPIAVGDPVTIELRSSADTPVFRGPSFEISYDADALSFQNIAFGSVFNIVPLPENTPSEPAGATGPQTLSPLNAGTLATNPSITLPSGATLLATLDFVATGDTASTTVTFDGFLLSPDGSRPFDGTASLDLAIGTDDVTMSPVPLPASALLLLSGVAAIAATRRRRANT